ncbi:uncharacterized protein EV422DRAFT_620048 [Fimicolochytrium jonesii]|uniref:uncharacterized protein n=1 Tax=Fimicolochytrium jonesii TaxID=1396493 RepID=UPI0022FF2DB3|nr:uncharacterized protein EV422DRAFT_620048 [Fimicolochytrium jonesii]KAI8821163.1 hypothetical protein EV422DRAFT_620048 [Fimicolochytrium jonesii]
MLRQSPPPHSISPAPPPPLSPALAPRIKLEFDRDGFCVIPNAITEDDVDLLRREADALFNAADVDVVAELGCIVRHMVFVGWHDCARGTSHMRYDFRHRSSRSRMRTAEAGVFERMVCGTLAGYARAVLLPSPKPGPRLETIMLYNEQYIVKPPFQGARTAFGWHRDGEYVRDEQRGGSVACWVALDDVDETNGTLHIQPFTAPHCTHQPPIVTIRAQAGTMVILASHVMHCSTPNLSRRFRMCFMPQFFVRGGGEGEERQGDAEGREGVGLAIPC